jgi:hypothetical protein
VWTCKRVQTKLAISHIAERYNEAFAVFKQKFSSNFDGIAGVSGAWAIIISRFTLESSSMDGLLSWLLAADASQNRKNDS